MIGILLVTHESLGASLARCAEHILGAMPAQLECIGVLPKDDPAQVRLPKISSFPKNQLFTRRNTPASWKDDPILAATQEALLPELPHEVQEGYIRIAPEPAPKRGG